MTKKEKNKLIELNQNIMLVIETLDKYCSCFSDCCENCPLSIDEFTCCVSTSQFVSNNITTLTKEKTKNGYKTVTKNEPK